MFSPSAVVAKESRCVGRPHHFISVVKLHVVGGFKRGASRLPERRISAKHISVYAHHKVFLFFLPPSSTRSLLPTPAQLTLSLCVCLTPGAGTGDAFSASLYVSLAVSLTALVALVVLLVNCVTCCKDREIDFKVRVWRPAGAQDVDSLPLCLLINGTIKR